MRKKLPKTVSLCVAAGLMACVQGMPAMAAEAPPTEVQGENPLVGTMAFAQCNEYINVRAAATTDSEVTAKIYNNGSVTIEEQDGEWFRIRSGNAEGYVKAEYFATGAEAEEIAQRVAYNVASVYPDELNVRSAPNEECEVIDVAMKQEELEVVAWDGDWMKVALGGDVYGYVSAYYVAYKTYYPVAETIEEEQARLQNEQAAAEAANYEGSGEESAQETEAPAAEPEYTETEAPVTEPEYTETDAPVTEPQYTETEPQYTETEAPATEPQYTETEPQYTETEAPATEPQYTETEAPATEPQYTETEAPATEPQYTETEAPATEPQYTETEAPETEPQYTETEAPATEPQYTETETPATEPQYTETEAPTSGVGQQIADFAVQYVGGPYAWGGTSLTNGADCSGFVQTVFSNFGIGLARTAETQAYGGTSVSLSDIQAGDLLFYNSTGVIDHVAIYIGGGQIVHAANSKSGIITSSAYYQTPVCARRYW